MQFKLVLVGIVLLVVGLVAYSSIPNVQRSPLLTTQAILGPEDIQVIGGSSVSIPKNVTVQSGSQNNLKVNLTVTTQLGALGTLRLQLFLRNSSSSCSITQPSKFLLDQKVSNATLVAPVNATGTYCFIFDNEDYPDDKVASVSAFLDTHSEKILVTRDGGANTAGLGLGAFGLLIFVYGVTKRTVIPWE